jgi:dTMP kinase
VPGERGAGRLVVFEGPEGAGKSTQLARVAAWLRAHAVPVRVVREPGTSALGQEIRRLVLEMDHDVAPAAEALLFMAARAQLVRDELRPALSAGELVLADRFFLSTYAYQIHGRGLAEHEVVTANRLATGGLAPDLTLLLRVPPSVGLERAGRRGAQDRIEQAGAAFHARVGEGFERFASPGWQAAHPEAGPIVVVDGTGDEAAVFDRMAAALVGSLAERWPALAAAAGGGSAL